MQALAACSRQGISASPLKFFCSNGSAARVHYKVL
jgi:hypothetical protein